MVTYIKSPLVGVVRLSKQGELRSARVKGDIVKKGDVLCEIEAMELSIEIRCEHSVFRITEILVGNGSTVDFDQPLFAGTIDENNYVPSITNQDEQQLPYHSAPVPIASNIVGHDNQLDFRKEDRISVESLLENEEGYIVGRLGDQPLKLITDAHLITIAPTRGGKGTGVIIPNLLAHPGSAFVIDIRGETVAKTATAKLLQGHRVVILDPYEITKGQWGLDNYNPLDSFLKDHDSLMSDDIIERIARSLMHDPEGRMSKEPIWDSATRDLIRGLLTLCLRFWPPYRQNLLEIYKILTHTSKEMDVFTAELELLIETDPKAKDDYILKDLLQVLTSSREKTKITDNAIYQAKTVLSWVGKRAFKEHTTTSTFSFDSIQSTPTAIYLVVPEQFVDNCAVWGRLMLESAVFSQEDIFMSKGMTTRELKQENRVLFLLDEVPAFGKLDIVDRGMATIGGRGINLWLFFQNLAQIKAIYKDNAPTIIGNASCIQSFSSSELNELEYFVKLVGEEFFDVPSVTIGETETEGESKTKGRTHTITNSSSITNSTTTSDSINESRSINWSRAASWARSLNRSTNESSSSSTNRSLNIGTQESSSTGRNTGVAKSVSRGSLWSTGVSENRGFSTQDNSGKTSSIGGSTGKSSSVGTTSGQSKSRTVTKTKGESTTTGHTHTEGQSTASTTQKGESLGQTENRTESYSKAVQRTISVTKKRMSIETVRSIREKLSGKNQLLYVRGAQPFFTPKMSYFVRYRDAQQYMFSDMICMTKLSVIGEIVERSVLHSEVTTEPVFRIKSKTIDKLESYLTIAKREDITRDEAVEVAKRFRDFLNSHISELQREITNSVISAERQISQMDEVALTTLALIAAMKNLGDSTFMESDIELVKRMENLSYRPKEKSFDLMKATKDFRGLPISEITDEYLVKHQYDDIQWLVATYAKAMDAAIIIIRKQIESAFDYLQAVEDTKVWLKSTLSKVQSNIDKALINAIERENENRSRFFMERYLPK